MEFIEPMEPNYTEIGTDVEALVDAWMHQDIKPGEAITYLISYLQAHERRFEMMEKRFNQQEQLVGEMRADIVRWRGEVQTLKKR